jgi:hypothetical protein
MFSMKLPASSIIAREKVTEYLLVRQSRNDKSAFLEKGGYSSGNPDALIVGLKALQEQGDATPIDSNQFGVYFEIVGILRGPVGIGLRVRTIWMTEHLSGVTKFITLIPIETLDL